MRNRAKSLLYKDIEKIRTGVAEENGLAAESGACGTSVQQRNSFIAANQAEEKHSTAYA